MKKYCLLILNDNFVFADSFRANGCLAFGGYSFDASNIAAGDVSPQNVCRLALYGDQVNK